MFPSPKQSGRIHCEYGNIDPKIQLVDRLLKRFVESDDMKITRQNSLTLALEGDAIPLEKFKQAVTSFLDLIESVSREATGTGQKIIWEVSVKAGSSLVEAIPKRSIETRDAIGEVVAAIQEGIGTLERGIAETPRLFNNAAVKAVKRLGAVNDLEGSGLIGVRIIGARSNTVVTHRVTKTVNEIIGTSYESYGSIEGKLEALWAHEGFKFSVFDQLFARRVDCYVSDELVDDAIQNFRQRVRTSGVVQYNKMGLPLNIRVKEIQPLPPNHKLPRPSEIRGIFKN